MSPPSRASAAAGAGAADCLFCAIGAGTEPAAVVWRDDQVCAFLDARPVFKGHVLVVPRAHVPTLLQLPAPSIGPFFAAVQRVTGAVEQALQADGSFVAANNKVSQSVAHLHVHVVPRRRKDGLRGFFWPRVPYASNEERDQFAALIAAVLQAAPPPYAPPARG
jgi:histidine triad (HIT) family protein